MFASMSLLTRLPALRELEDSGDSFFCPPLNADELRKVVEVLVSRMQYEIVLQDQSGQPHVVCWNRRALLPKLAKNRGVVMGRLFIGEEDTYAVFHEKPPKCALVLGLSDPHSKAGPKLT